MWRPLHPAAPVCFHHWWRRMVGFRRVTRGRSFPYQVNRLCSVHPSFLLQSSPPYSQEEAPSCSQVAWRPPHPPYALDRLL
ncbi:hypothetical protein U0070_009281 [Myodes glareolus]|uniref:Secreted protein n=1 Tax=Myodes glareolus TaxID=447135 RepID=A0AAW0IRL5_MYOGA